jgi:hypothetical protein
MAVSESHLVQLVSGWIDGEVDAASHQDLQLTLRESPEARKLYFACMVVHAELDATAKGKEYLAGLGADDDRGPAAVQTSTSTQRSQKRPLIILLAIAATLLLAATIGVLHHGWSLAGSEPVIQAEVREVSPECQWYVENAKSRASEPFHRGHVLRVASGKLQLRYSQGVDVTLHAPAAYEFISATNARMILGRMTAHVDEGGKGFTVLSPRARVVDLGTQFGIEVNSDGATDVVVFKGEVDVEFLNFAKGGSQQQRLRMGQAVRVDAGGTKSRLVAINSGLYSSALVEPAHKRPPVITVVTDNISRGSSDYFYEIVHAGMKEDAPAFVDRIAHQYNGVDQRGMPAYLIGGDYVKTFNNDKDTFDKTINIDVTLAAPATVYVLLDERIETPQWLKDSFTNTNDVIGIDTGPFYDPVNKVWHNKGPSGVGPGESVEDRLTIWARTVSEPSTIRLGPLGVVKKSAFEPNQPRYLLGRNMYGIVAVPLDSSD